MERKVLCDCLAIKSFVNYCELQIYKIKAKNSYLVLIHTMNSFFMIKSVWALFSITHGFTAPNRFLIKPA